MPGRPCGAAIPPHTMAARSRSIPGRISDASRSEWSCCLCCPSSCQDGRSASPVLPYDPRWAIRFPKRAAWMSLAGPAGNLTLVLAATLVIRVGSAAGVFSAPASIRFDHIVMSQAGGVWPAAAFLLSVLFSLNLLLAVFNLIPVPPLDGSGAVPLLLDDRMTARYQQFVFGQPAFAWIGILLAWQVFPTVFDPLWLFAVNLVHSGAHYG